MAVRWGILGCGDIAVKRVADAILEDEGSILLAACRRNEENLASFCKRFKVEKACTIDADLINDPEIDVVYVSTPVSLHLHHTALAAQAGKHVLVEKPMARSAEECRSMIDICKRQGVKLGVAYYRRFYPAVQRIKEILQSGDLGRPLCISAATATPFDINPNEDGYWRVEPDEGGGALMDIGSHRLDLFLDLLGEVIEVKAHCSTLAGDYQGEDCATLTMTFASGCHGTLQCFFRTPVELDDFTVIGTKGRMTSSPLNDGQLLIDIPPHSSVEDLKPCANFHAPLITDFREAVELDRAPKIPGEEGLKVNEVMEKAYNDARSA